MIRIVYIFCLIVFITACTTTKNTWVNRNYHNITNRFNVRFNAEQSYLQGIKKIELQGEDYTKLLPVFNLGDDVTHKSAIADMDKCIKKSSDAINKHSMMIRGIEYCKWIDENYQLMGQSYLVKREYFTALEDFDYVSKQYKKSPTRFIARLWLTRAYGELGNFPSADQMLETLREDKDFRVKKYNTLFYLTKADIAYKKHEYSKCIDYIDRAMPTVKSKLEKSRLYFLLAQLYELEDNRPQALLAYKKVIKYKANNKMLFYAKIARAKNFTGDDIAAATLEKEFLKMSKDIKYEEYTDQIYYSLSELAERQSNEPKQILYLTKCVQAKSSNKRQKALAHLKLGNIYYKNEVYKPSYLQYDTALSSAEKRELPNYIELDSRRATLKRLVVQLDTIQLQDSLLRLANLSPKEQEEFVEKFIKEEKRKEEKRKELEFQKAIAESASSKNNIDIPGAWYFYNATARNQGLQDFINKWGNRILEDNWRRNIKDLQDANSKSSEEDQENTESNERESVSREENKREAPNLKRNEQDANIQENEVLEDKVRKPVAKNIVTNSTSDDGNKIKEASYYLKSIPKTEPEIKKAQASLINAYYAAANMYREELGNDAKAILLFEEMLTKFPENKYKLVCYYQLYRLYLKQGDIDKSDKYKNIILKDYEFSEYGQLISDPTYNVENEKVKAKAEKLYVQAFESYKEEEYESVIRIANTAISQYKQNELTPKFLYLRALAYSKTQGIVTMVKELNNLIVKYPSDPIKNEALLILAAVKAINPDSLNSLKSDSSSIYTFVENNNNQLFYITIVDKQDDIEKIKIAFGDFVFKNFELDNLYVNNLSFNDNQFAIIIKTLVSKEKAKVFLDKLKVDKTFDPYKNNKSYIITQPNLTKLFATKNIVEYGKYYAKYYPEFAQ